MRGGKSRVVPPKARELIEPHGVHVGGSAEMVMLGTCCLCGRPLHRSHLNKTGVRCYYEGAQYDRSGKFLFDARTEKLYKAAQKVRSALGVENDIEVINLVDAAEELCAQ